jgi:hypothetical protein
MATISRKINFFDTEDGVAFEQELKDMDANAIYATSSSYSTNSELYPDNLIPFVDKHMNYMRSHPSTNAQHYLANLRLMTRIR